MFTAFKLEKNMVNTKIFHRCKGQRKAIFRYTLNPFTAGVAYIRDFLFLLAH